MESLELELKYVQVLIKKAYEWRRKINRRNHRLNFFKTNHAIRRFKNYIKHPELKFAPNKNEILLTMVWFLRCPPHDEFEKLVFTLISLVYKLHRAKLSNLIAK
jgi:hypothetical protein